MDSDKGSVPSLWFLGIEYMSPGQKEKVKKKNPGEQKEFLICHSVLQSMIPVNATLTFLNQMFSYWIPLATALSNTLFFTSWKFFRASFQSYLQGHQKAASFMVAKNDSHFRNLSPHTNIYVNQPWDYVGLVSLGFFLWDGSSQKKELKVFKYIGI